LLDDDGTVGSDEQCGPDRPGVDRYRVWTMFVVVECGRHV